MNKVKKILFVVLMLVITTTINNVEASNIMSNEKNEITFKVQPYYQVGKYKVNFANPSTVKAQANQKFVFNLDYSIRDINKIVDSSNLIAPSNENEIVYIQYTPNLKPNAHVQVRVLHNDVNGNWLANEDSYNVNFGEENYLLKSKTEINGKKVKVVKSKIVQLVNYDSPGAVTITQDNNLNYYLNCIFKDPYQVPQIVVSYNYEYVTSDDNDQDNSLDNNDNQYTVNYLNNITNKQIIESDSYIAKEQDKWQANPYEITGYKYIPAEGEKNIVRNKNKITVNYYYQKISDETPKKSQELIATLTIKHIDIDTNKELQPTIVETTIDGLKYTTIAAKIPNYKLVKTSNNETGVFKIGNTEVIYYYKDINLAQDDTNKDDTNKEDTNKEDTNKEDIINEELDKNNLENNKVEKNKNNKVKDEESYKYNLSKAINLPKTGNQKIVITTTLLVLVFVFTATKKIIK
ncbi:MucBP domain-containing protein [Mycoplasma sp. P36-A1]|uniref:MucBP domain-containing protein n=1 Tax=Mycoplasma sp. P36-A1 TaxID=3252900 RepID=UPI003C2B019F